MPCHSSATLNAHRFASPSPQSIQVYLGLREAEEKSLYEEMQDEMSGMCPSLSYRQRLWGFAICVCIGSVLDTFGVSKFSDRSFGVLMMKLD
jgi:hypothetical protein